MGINPLKSYNNFSQNSITDHGAELQRQLDARRTQLEKLSSKDVLSGEQLSRKKDLEQTVSMLEGKLQKHLGTSVPATDNKKSSGNANELTIHESGAKSPVQTFSEGTVISKKSYPQTPYNAQGASNTYLKGFFFDARI